MCRELLFSFAMDRRGLSWIILIFMLFPNNCGSHLIDGIFTEPTLESGYNLVTTVPKGALSLNVTELRHTQNYLAIRLENGSYLLNGNYSIHWSGEYKAVGTTFIYYRQSSENLESFSAAGPLQESIDIMVLYQEPNPGIVYRYVVPGPANPSYNHPGSSNYPTEFDGQGSYRKSDINGSGDESVSSYPHWTRRQKKKKFYWKSIGYTECTKSCGRGVQMVKYVCIRDNMQVQVPDKRCHALERPQEIRTWCNTQPCLPLWKLGSWSECSVTCGNGMRTRSLECVQELKPSMVISVADGACVEPKPGPVNEICTMQTCNNAKYSPSQWHIGPWSECSEDCGPGNRTRTVTCITQDQPCNPNREPPTYEKCNGGPCAISSNSQWLYTEWSNECSVECGTGLQTRRVYCESRSSDDPCNESNRPESTRFCASNFTCSGQWFVGPWSGCSAECDVGEEIREVVCVTTLRGALRVVLDMNCPAKKPETKKPCKNESCEQAWFVSDWNECSKSCGRGFQTREVRCLTSEGMISHSSQPRCDENNQPVAHRVCSDWPCKDDFRDGSRRALQVHDDPEIVNGLDNNSSCKDTINNCNLVIQARLCSYKFYQQSCCSSCSRMKIL